ncbi:recombinase family protein [Chloroflexota bacterium]
MKAALYLRVSSGDQNTDNQLPALEAYAASRGYEVTEVCREEASAWKDGHQRELARLLQDIRSGYRHYDAVLVFALDRLSRQGPLTVLTLIDSFKAYGVKVESLNEPFTALPYGFDSVVYSFLAWVAKYESDRKSQNTRAGLDRARAAGKKLGRPIGKKDSKKRRKKRPVVYRREPVSVGTNTQ